MTKRLNKLWNFIDENLEVDYGYLPQSRMDDDRKVDEYIQEIKDDFKEMRSRGLIKENSMHDSIDVLKDLDKI